MANSVKRREITGNNVLTLSSEKPAKVKIYRIGGRVTALTEISFAPFMTEKWSQRVKDIRLRE